MKNDDRSLQLWSEAAENIQIGIQNLVEKVSENIKKRVKDSQEAAKVKQQYLEEMNVINKKIILKEKIRKNNHGFTCRKLEKDVFNLKLLKKLINLKKV